MRDILRAICSYKNTRRCLLFAVIPAGFFYSVSLVTMWNSGFSVIEIIRDSAQSSRISPFLGFLSSIGSWLWVGSTILAFYIYNSANAEKSGVKKLLALVGLLSFSLAVDDYFMIHDKYIMQELCYGFYAICAIALLTINWRMIIEIDAIAFLLACALLGSSVGFDLIQNLIPMDYRISQIIEEGFKFLGAATWLYFISRIGRFSERAQLEESSI